MKLCGSAGLTAAETKQCADKLLKTTKSNDIPATGPLNYERDGYVSLCSPSAAYKTRRKVIGLKSRDSTSSMSGLGVRARRCTFTHLCLSMTFMQVLWLLEVCSVTSCLTFDSYYSLLHTDWRLQCNVECRSLQDTSTDLDPAPEMTRGGPQMKFWS